MQRNQRQDVDSMRDGKSSYDSDSSEPVVEDIRGGVQDLQAPLLDKEGFLEQHNVTSPALLRRIFSTKEDSEWMQMRGSVVCIGVEMRFEYAVDAVYYYTGTGVVIDNRVVLTAASLFEAPQRQKELGQPTIRIYVTTDISPDTNELVRGTNTKTTSVRGYLVAWGPRVDTDDLVLPHKYFSRPNTDMETNLALIKTKLPIPNCHPIFPHHRKKGPKSLQLCTYNQMPTFDSQPDDILHQMQQLFAPGKQPEPEDLQKQIAQLLPGKFSVASTSLWKGVKYRPYSRITTQEVNKEKSIRERKIADCKKLQSDFYSSCICYRISTLGGSTGGALCVDGKWVGIHMGQVKYLEFAKTDDGLKEVQALNEHSCGIGLWLDSRKASQWLRINVPLHCEIKRRARWVQFGIWTVDKLPV